MREYLIGSTTVGSRGEWRVYASRRSAERYATHHGMVVLDSRAAGEQYPHPNDTQGWDDLRMRAGHPSY